MWPRSTHYLVLKLFVIARQPLKGIQIAQITRNSSNDVRTLQRIQLQGNLVRLALLAHL